MKIREEINKIEIIKVIEKINKTRNLFFERINSQQISIQTHKEEKRVTQISKISNERREIATNTTEL